MRLDPRLVRQQIEALLLTVPELAEDDVLRADMIEGETDLFDVLAMLMRKRQEAAALANGLGGPIADMKARKQRFERRADAMDDLAFKLLDASGLRKAELPIATVSIAKGQRSVVVTDEALLPDSVVKIERTPDKIKIKELLTAGEALPGATLTNGSPHLTVKFK